MRNAIQALQDFTFSSIQSQADLNSRFPARSIPNIPNVSAASEPRILENDHASMVRSTSHPPEMWGREMSTDSYNPTDPFEKLGLDFLRKPSMSYNLPEVSSGTQTEDCDYETIQRIVRSNLHLVLNILGRNLLSKYHQMSLSTIAELSNESLCDLLIEESDSVHLLNQCCDGDSDNNDTTGPKANENNHIKPARHRMDKHVSIVEAVVDNSDDSSPISDGPIFGSGGGGHGESCVIVLNEDDVDVIPEGSVKKRYNNLIIKKTPLSNRFSAGDADKLEKGVVPSMPSTRSLKEM